MSKPRIWRTSTAQRKPSRHRSVPDSLGNIQSSQRDIIRHPVTHCDVNSYIAIRSIVQMNYTRLSCLCNFKIHLSIRQRTVYITSELGAAFWPFTTKWHHKSRIGNKHFLSRQYRRKWRHHGHCQHLNLNFLKHLFSVSFPCDCKVAEVILQFSPNFIQVRKHTHTHTKRETEKERDLTASIGKKLLQQLHHSRNTAAKLTAK